MVKRGLEGLVEEKVVDVESMIDLLTLKKRGHGPSAENEFETYFWALQVLRASEVSLKKNMADVVAATSKRRCVETDLVTCIFAG